MSFHLRAKVLGTIAVCGVLTGIVALDGGAQQSNQGSESKEGLREKAFLALQQERDTLDRTIREKEGELKDLRNALIWRKLELEYKDALDAKRKSPKTASSEIEALQKKIEEAHANGMYPNSEADLNKSIEKTQEDVDSQKKQKNGIEAEMSRRVDIEKPKQEFKTNLSIAFAALVGIVIVGFYPVVSG